MSHLQAVITNNKRLSVFIRDHMELVLAEWEIFARSLMSSAYKMTGLALRDHAQKILEFIADDIESTQTSFESAQKGRGEATKKDKSHPSAAETHGRIRVKEGFNIVQVVSEYRALRASVIRLWTKEQSEITALDLTDLTRFNEAIDQALAESVAFFTEKLDRSKSLFLGVLGHDMRNPLGAIAMSAQLIHRGLPLNAKQQALVAQISDSAMRMEEIIDQLIDLTRTRIGTGIPIVRASMDIGALARQMVGEIQARYPERNITLTVAGNMSGDWDRARLGQVFSNLLGNAVQYSEKDTRVTVSLEDNSGEILLSVHNEGKPIDPNAIRTLFDSLVRTLESTQGEHTGSTSLGLGLYIAKEIVVSHGGTITVISNRENGTTFKVSLPRLRDSLVDDAANLSEVLEKSAV